MSNRNKKGDSAFCRNKPYEKNHTLTFNACYDRGTVGNAFVLDRLGRYAD